MRASSVDSGRDDLHGVGASLGAQEIAFGDDHHVPIPHRIAAHQVVDGVLGGLGCAARS